MVIDNESKIKALSKELNELSSKYDHDYLELVDSGISEDIITETMKEELTYEIENVVTKFELKNPDLYILSISRHDGEDGLPEVVLEWSDATEEDEEDDD